MGNLSFKPPGVPAEAGLQGYNEYGVPYHACNGQRHDEHYWAWIRARNVGNSAPTQPL